jgi:hypothetical protein
MPTNNELTLNELRRMVATCECCRVLIMSKYLNEDLGDKKGLWLRHHELVRKLGVRIQEVIDDRENGFATTRE